MDTNVLGGHGKILKTESEKVDKYLHFTRKLKILVVPVIAGALNNPKRENEKTGNQWKK